MDTLVTLKETISQEIAPTPEVLAQGLTLCTRRGAVYRDVDLSLNKGEVAAIAGPSGSGKTALLLTLAGRMRPTSGSATVCGFDVTKSARRVRRLIGLSIFPGVNDLDDTTTIEAQVRAELILHHLPHDKAAVHRLLQDFDVDAQPRAEIGSLSRAEQILLGIGLGLLHRPRVLMVDGADLNLTGDERSRVWRTVRELGNQGITVMTSCVEPPPAGFADIVYSMGGAR